MAALHPSQDPFASAAFYEGGDVSLLTGYLAPMTGDTKFQADLQTYMLGDGLILPEVTNSDLLFPEGPDTWTIPTREALVPNTLTLPLAPRLPTQHPALVPASPKSTVAPGLPVAVPQVDICGTSADDLSPASSADPRTVPTAMAPHATMFARAMGGVNPCISPPSSPPETRKRSTRVRTAPRRYIDSFIAEPPASALSDMDGTDDEADDAASLCASSVSDVSYACSVVSDYAPLAAPKRRRVSVDDLLVAEAVIGDEEEALQRFRRINALDAREEEQLRKQLRRQMRELENSGAQMKGMSSSERKKMRNRKASRISRLKRKLSVFDLQVRYEKEVAERQRLAHLAMALNSQVQSCVQYIQRYEPSFHSRHLPRVVAQLGAGSARQVSDERARKRVKGVASGSTDEYGNPVC